MSTVTDKYTHKKKHFWTTHIILFVWIVPVCLLKFSNILQTSETNCEWTLPPLCFQILYFIRVWPYFCLLSKSEVAHLLVPKNWNLPQNNGISWNETLKYTHIIRKPVLSEHSNKEPLTTAVTRKSHWLLQYPDVITNELDYLLTFFIQNGYPEKTVWRILYQET
jgi:hypothetical protein